jgi:hypothetical protein
MSAIAKYRRMHRSDPTPANAVRLIISRTGNETVAEVEWPENSLTVAGDYVYPTYVPLALERAEDVRSNYRFAEIVVIIEDPSTWEDEWGILVF